MRNFVKSLLVAAALTAAGAPSAQAQTCPVTSAAALNDLRIMMRDAPGTMVGLMSCIGLASSEYDTVLRRTGSERRASDAAGPVFGICAVTVCLFAGDGCFTVADRSISMYLRSRELQAMGC